MTNTSYQQILKNTSTYKTYSIVTVLNRKYAIKANKIYKI
ncbi:hypothetical protein GV51_0179 [Gardnerella vaginalis 5-1]|nr:hypothetical protein GV51_0179 [Gardnerella vaginalis 5-1]